MLRREEKRYKKPPALYDDLPVLASQIQQIIPTLHPFGSLQLLCGGFAGSTAALCTTPFDVVKTRVQLQVL
jgi:hypothetical protein